MARRLLGKCPRDRARGSPARGTRHLSSCRLPRAPPHAECHQRDEARGERREWAGPLAREVSPGVPGRCRVLRASAESAALTMRLTASPARVRRLPHRSSSSFPPPRLPPRTSRVEQLAQPLARPHRAHLRRRQRNSQRRRRLLHTEIPHCQKEQHLAVRTPQARQRVDDTRPFAGPDRRLLRILTAVPRAEHVLDRSPQLPPDHRPGRPPAGDGENEGRRRIGRTVVAPPLHERGQGVLGDLLGERSVAGLELTVAEQFRGEFADNVVQVHGEQVPEAGRWSHVGLRLAACGLRPAAVSAAPSAATYIFADASRRTRTPRRCSARGC